MVSGFDLLFDIMQLETGGLWSMNKVIFFPKSVFVFGEKTDTRAYYEPRIFDMDTNEGSNQYAHPYSLIRMFLVRMKKICIFSYSKCIQ